MEVVRLKSWKSFKLRVDALFDQSSQLRIDTGRTVSNPVFRGQANSKLSLATTLERELGTEVDLIKFYQDILYPSLTQLRRALNFELPPLSTLDLKSLKFRDLGSDLPWSDKLALLRHHGSPSPLLDWTYSPYVAAFFAFTPLPASATGRVAIFAYRQFVGQSHGYASDKPQIGFLGHWMPVHGRHIRQQSTYTFCVEKIGSSIAFVSHEHASKRRAFKHLRFDDIIKYEIPVSEREKALCDLRRMNVTEYSLFETDDALVRTVVRFASKPKVEG